MEFTHVIDLWPTMPEMADDIGETKVNVFKWRQRNSIPPHRWLRIVYAAQRRKYPAVTLIALAEMAERRAEV